MPSSFEILPAATDLHAYKLPFLTCSGSHLLSRTTPQSIGNVRLKKSAIRLTCSLQAQAALLSSILPLKTQPQQRIQPGKQSLLWLCLREGVLLDYLPSVSLFCQTAKSHVGHEAICRYLSESSKPRLLSDAAANQGCQLLASLWLHLYTLRRFARHPSWEVRYACPACAACLADRFALRNYSFLACRDSQCLAYPFCASNITHSKDSARQGAISKCWPEHR